MASLNKCIIIGNVGRDPEMRFTPDGKPVTSFSVAMNRTYTDGSGERRESTDWMEVTAWNKLAETCNQYVTKGMQVYCEGRVQLHTWDRQDGTTGAKMQMTASQVIFLGGKQATENGGAGDAGDTGDLPF